MSLYLGCKTTLFSLFFPFLLQTKTATVTLVCVMHVQSCVPVGFLSMNFGYFGVHWASLCMCKLAPLPFTWHFLTVTSLSMAILCILHACMNWNHSTET